MWKRTTESWGVTLPIVFGLTPDVFPVFFEQDIGVLSAGTVGWGDIIFIGLQPFNDLFSSLIIGRSAPRVKIGHYLVETIYADLGIIDEFQRMPTNCRLWRGSAPSLSTFPVMENQEIVLMLILRHSVPPQLFLSTRRWAMRLSRGARP
jgi:hypothetical protein